MSYSPILAVHICAGSLGLLSGPAAMLFRKGSRRHVLAGRVFVAAMLTMAVGATYLAIVMASTQQHQRRDSNLLSDRDGMADCQAQRRGD